MPLKPSYREVSENVVQRYLNSEEPEDDLVKIGAKKISKREQAHSLSNQMTTDGFYRKVKIDSDPIQSPSEL